MDKSIDSSLVELLVHTLNDHTLLKDAKSGKYLDANHKHVSVYNLNKPEEIIGSTVWDLNSVMNQMWLDNARQIAKYDEEVIATGKPFIHPKRVWLNAQGQVWAHHLSKIPVTNTKKSVVAILGIGHDLTHTLTLDELYSYYCQFYKNKTFARRKFLEHTNISNMFIELPTHAELRVLIAKSTFIQNKEIANHLKISLATVETHINRLGQKTNNLALVCSLLRSW